MIFRLTTCHEIALSPLGERAACDGAFISRRGSGEGACFALFMAVAHARRLTDAQKP
jgi:hypothetical protein